MEFKKSITIDFSIDVVINWKCPHCGKEHHTEYSESPYTIIADDPADIQCEGCGKFITLNFYENEKE